MPDILAICRKLSTYNHKNMKNLFYLFALLFATTLFSCSDDIEQDNSKPTSNAEEQSATNLLTRASIATSDSISPLEMNDSMRYLLNLQKKIKKPRKAMPAPENYDANFSSNMFAIRELPVTIEVMEAGKDKSRKYLYCDKAGAEVKLSGTKNQYDMDQQFYIRILPAATGIPYMLYSEKSKTPLTVGHYNKTPNIQVLMSSSTVDISNSFTSWDLKPASTPGYFAIENDLLLGQKNINGVLSVFNYYLEVNDNDEIRFAEYTKKSQQHFLIKPIDKFTVTNVDFDLENAKVTDATPFEANYNRKYNKVEKGTVYSENLNLRVTEKSWFKQNRSNINFDLIDTAQLKMPTVLARKALLMDEDSNRIGYITSGYQNVYSNRGCKVNGTIPESVNKCLILVSVKFTAYNVEVPYTVYAKYNDREIKFTGTWKGYVIADPEYVPPVKTIRYFDMITGEELFSSKAGTKSFKMKK